MPFTIETFIVRRITCKAFQPWHGTELTRRGFRFYNGGFVEKSLLAVETVDDLLEIPEKSTLPIT